MTQTVDKNETNPFEGWVGLADAASKIGHDIALVRKWAREGKIRGFTFGNRIMVVNIDEVIEYNKVYSAESQRARKPAQNSK